MGRLSDRNRFYGLMLALCAAGYIWLWLGMRADGFVTGAYAAGGSGHGRDSERSIPWQARHELPGVCLFKQATTVPCPSCGSTRSVLHILHGDLGGGLSWNPLGFVLLAGLVILPVWIAHDLLRRRGSLLVCFRRAESWLRKWWIALPAIILVLANWAWNLFKGF